MICPKCNRSIVLANSKFCPECGAKIEALPLTPDLVKVFTGVTGIKLGVGNEFDIRPSNSGETKITIKASEELKKQLKVSLVGGLLSVEPSSNTHYTGISINGSRITVGGGISFAHSVSSESIMIGRNNRIFIGDKNVILTEEAEVVITITTPIGVDVSIDSDCGISGRIGDLDSKISLDSSGRANFVIGKIKDFEADISGSLAADIASFNGGICNVDISGSCALAIRSGTIGKLIVDVSGAAVLDVNAETEKAVLDISGSITGKLRANIVHKDISGRDGLTIIR